MDIKAEKLQLIQQILRIQDLEVIRSIKSLLNHDNKKKGIEDTEDFWTNLSDIQKSQIEKSIKQLDNGEGIKHQVVMTEFRKKYQK